MRRVAFLAALIVGLLLVSQLVCQMQGSIPPSTHASRHLQQLHLLPLHFNPTSSPPAASPQPVWREELGEDEKSVVAYVTNISSLAHWQRVAAGCVNAARQMGLLEALTSFESRHPFVEGGNASLDLLAGELEGMGMQVVEDWFPVVRSQWNGTAYVNQLFWTRNLYVCPWGVNGSWPSLVVTCHVDSARYSYIGLTPSPAPGANDDASGVVAALEALRILTGFNLTGGWNVVFAFLGGEEGNSTLHLWGSRRLLEGLPSLGVNLSTALILNLDEVGYKGLVLPSRLAIYRYLGEGVEPLLGALLEASRNLGIVLVDVGEPRVSTAAEVDSYKAWSTSEWTFHSRGIPSLTISTDQYPDPYKHTSSDVASRCNPDNLCNVSRLVAAVALALAYRIPPSPPNYAADWVPQLSSGAGVKVAVVDYLNVTYSPRSSYSAQVLDPSLTLDSRLAQSLLVRGTPILALGWAGAQLIQAATGTAITDEGVNGLRVRGLLSLHPALGYSYLLAGKEAAPLRNCSTVWAVKPVDRLLVLVGNSSWCSIGLYTGSPASSLILFLGVGSPEDQGVARMAASSLAWVMEGSTAGLILGLGMANPMVGDRTTLYAVVCNLTTWTGFAGEEVQVNVTGPMGWDNQRAQLVTNGTGVAELELWFRSPSQLEIGAASESGYQAHLVVTPAPACLAEIDGSRVVMQGELLSLRCTAHSSLSRPERVNMSLGSPAVGVVEVFNVLLMPGSNTYLMDLEVEVGCPPGNHTITLNITTSDLLLLHQYFPLEVKQAFSLILEQAPSSITQQIPFEVQVSVANLGSQERVFDIQPAPGGGFQGSRRVVVAANRTLSFTLSIVYLPATAIDVGMRSLQLELRLEGVLLCSLQILLQVGYSTPNLLLALLPYAALGMICLAGLWWMRPASRWSRRPRRRLNPPPPHRRFRASYVLPSSLHSAQLGWSRRGGGSDGYTLRSSHSLRGGHAPQAARDSEIAVGVSLHRLLSFLEKQMGTPATPSDIHQPDNGGDLTDDWVD